jgi:hypothetical protein
MNFKIRKGWQFSRLLPIFLRDKHFGLYDITIEFDKIMPEQDFYNKLIGIGKLAPESRSERVGWRFIEGDRILFCIYSEKNGNHIFISPFAVPIEYNSNTGRHQVKIRVQLQDQLITASAKVNGEPMLASHAFDPITSDLPLVLCKPYHGGRRKKAQQNYYFTFTKIK